MRKPSRQRSVRAQAGFSLVELMVAVVVMAIVTSQILLSFNHQHTSSLEHERTIEIQEEGRLVTDLMLRDLRAGGFMVPKSMAVASVDGGTAGSDLLCISDPSVIDDSTLTTATTRFAAATLSGAVGGNDSTIPVLTSSLDIDDDGDDDFSVGDGVIVGDGLESHCARITGIATSGLTTTLTVAPPTSSGFSVGTGEMAVPAVVYSLAGMTLSRNAFVLSNHVEDLQVEFGVDADRNGTVEGAEFPIDDLVGEEYELIRNVRVHLTARDLRAEPGFPGQFPAVANRVAGAADNFKRRRISGDAILRNLR